MRVSVWIVNIRKLQGHTLVLRSNDGAQRVVDLGAYLDGPIYKPLHDQAYFSQVRLNEETESIEWADGADFAPVFCTVFRPHLEKASMKAIDLTIPFISGTDSDKIIS